MATEALRALGEVGDSSVCIFLSPGLSMSGMMLFAARVVAALRSGTLAVVATGSGGGTGADTIAGELVGDTGRLGAPSPMSNNDSLNQDFRLSAALMGETGLTGLSFSIKSHGVISAGFAWLVNTAGGGEVMLKFEGKNGFASTTSVLCTYGLSTALCAYGFPSTTTTLLFLS